MNKDRERNVRQTAWLNQAGSSRAEAHRVLDGHEAVTDPAPCGAVATYVREGSVKVPIWGTERNFLYCLVHYEVLENGKQRGTEDLQGQLRFLVETRYSFHSTEGPHHSGSDCWYPNLACRHSRGAGLDACFHHKGSMWISALGLIHIQFDNACTVIYILLLVYLQI